MSFSGSQIKIKELLARLEGTGGLCGLQKAALRREVEAVLKDSSTFITSPNTRKSVI